jgi:hypothetical protein
VGKLRPTFQFPKSLLVPARRAVVRLSELAGVRGLRRHVVLCGFPRSGSTLLQLMVEACVADIHTFGRERRALEMAQCALCAKPYMLTKRPSDIFLIDALQRFYAGRAADVRFVVTVRDPRAVLTSMHAKIKPGEYYVSGERLRAIYEHWDWARTLDHVITIRHEDLIADPGGVQQALTEFAGWKVVRPFAEYQRAVPRSFDTAALNGLRPLDRGSIDRWRDPQYRDRLTRLLTDECPELPGMLIEMGYERDDRWTEAYVPPRRAAA